MAAPDLAEDEIHLALTRGIGESGSRLRFFHQDRGVYGFAIAPVDAIPLFLQIGILPPMGGNPKVMSGHDVQLA